MSTPVANNFAQALSDTRVLYRNMFVELQHPRGRRAQAPGKPIELSVDSAGVFTPPPLGADTTEVFLEWTESPADAISRGIEDGVLQQGEYPN